MKEFDYQKAFGWCVLLIVVAVLWISSLYGDIGNLRNDIDGWEAGAGMANESINEAKGCSGCDFDELQSTIDNLRPAEKY